MVPLKYIAVVALFQLSRAATTNDLAYNTIECAKFAIRQRPGLYDLELPDLNPLKIRIPVLKGTTEKYHIGYNVSFDNIEVFKLAEFSDTIRVKNDSIITFNSLHIEIYFNGKYNGTYQVDSGIVQQSGNVRFAAGYVRINGTVEWPSIRPISKLENLDLDINIRNTYASVKNNTDQNVSEIARHLSKLLREYVNKGYFKELIQLEVLSYLNNEWASKPEKTEQLFKLCRENGLPV